VRIVNANAFTDLGDGHEDLRLVMSTSASGAHHGTDAFSTSFAQLRRGLPVLARLRTTAAICLMAKGLAAPVGFNPSLIVADYEVYLRELESVAERFGSEQAAVVSDAFHRARYQGMFVLHGRMPVQTDDWLHYRTNQLARSSGQMALQVIANPPPSVPPPRSTTVGTASRQRQACLNWNEGACTRGVTCPYLHQCSVCSSIAHPHGSCPVLRSMLTSPERESATGSAAAHGSMRTPTSGEKPSRRQRRRESLDKRVEDAVAEAVQNVTNSLAAKEGRWQ